TAAAFATISTPAAFASSQRAFSMSKPTTCQPAVLKFFAIAPPMMPRPMIPTCPLEVAALMMSPWLARAGRNRARRGLLMQIGIAGLGRMGAAMAARLMETGHTLAVWNRTPAKAKPLTDAGATLADTPEDLAEHSDVIITILM